MLSQASSLPPRCAQRLGGIGEASYPALYELRSTCSNAGWLGHTLQKTLSNDAVGKKITAGKQSITQGVRNTSIHTVAGVQDVYRECC